MTARPITFLSDYGEADEFAGVCRAVIAQIAPEARVDRPQPRHRAPRRAPRGRGRWRTRRRSLRPASTSPSSILGSAAQEPPVAVATAAEGRLFVGPDNGLLSTAIARLGGAAEAVEIASSTVRLEPVSETFHGRDIFAPVAAHLALGEPLARLGRDDRSRLASISSSCGEPEVEPGVRLTAEVGYVDHFGNATLRATAADAELAGLRVGQRSASAPLGGPRKRSSPARSPRSAPISCWSTPAPRVRWRSPSTSAAPPTCSTLTAGERVALTADVSDFGHPHLHLRRIGSTNDRARELAEAGAPSGTIVTADEQSCRARAPRPGMVGAGRRGAAVLGDPAAARARAGAAAARGCRSPSARQSSR